MFKITDLTKKGKYYKLTITNENSPFNYKVSEDLLLEHRIFIGKEFSQHEMDLLLAEINRDVYYQKVLNYALFKPRTRKEIYTYLDKLKIQDYAYYLQKLEKIRLIDDKVYSENYISESINFKRIGPRKIKEDLKLKGIKTEMIDDFLHTYKANVLEENLDYWLEKKLKTIKNKPYYQAQKILINFLVNKGFEYDDVNVAVNRSNDKIKAEIDEEEIIIKEIKHLLEKYQKKDLKISLNQYLINKLLAKGYQYSIIKKYLEGSL